jgi:hypothetical protein
VRVLDKPNLSVARKGHGHGLLSSVHTQMAHTISHI